MSLNPGFFTSIDLNPYLVDKDTGAPLAGGYIRFYEDDSRTTPKAVYQLTGSPPAYTYTALPNPIQLSATGTIVDSSGNNCALYYYPYDEFGNLQLYYIEVTNSLGVNQFTREAWPNITEETNPLGIEANTIENLLSNPQFVDVLFDADNDLLISYTGTGSNVALTIAPDWDLVYSYTGSGTITVARTAIAGSANYPTNPPYSLSITPGNNLSQLYLRQRLPGNPGIWCPESGNDFPWVLTNILILSTASGANSVTIQYVPSTGTAQTLLDVSNTQGIPAEFSECVLLEPSNNTDTGDTGYVDINIYLNYRTALPIVLSSIQVCFLQAEAPVGVDNLAIVEFQQTPVNRQIDNLFHYYKPELEYKPIESYLIGWDFAYNPGQINGYSIAAQALGANTSYYAWDQTIVYQSATSGIAVSRAANGGFTALCNADTQMALIQYLDQATARDILNGRMSVNIAGRSSSVAGIGGKITLWYTNDASIIYSSNTSLVTGLDATGFPTSMQGTWTQVQRSGLGDAIWSLNDVEADYAFNGWQDNTNGVATATYFAIVVGTVPLTTTTPPDTLIFTSISLVPGDIATIPAPKTPTEVLRDCQRFYEKSYPLQTLPASVTLNNVLVAPQQIAQGYLGGGSTQYAFYAGLAPFQLTYQVPKRTASPTITFYSPVSGSSGQLYYNAVYNGTVIGPGGADKPITDWTNVNTNDERASYVPTTAAQAAIVNGASVSVGYIGLSYIEYHYVCDCRLGIV